MRSSAWIRRPVQTLALLLVMSGVCQGQEAAIMGVVLNTLPMGETFGYVTRGGDILLRAGFMRDIGIAASFKTIEMDGYNLVSLRSLAPQLTYRFDSQTLNLEMTADPGILGKSSFDLGRVRPEDLVYLERGSAFLNYSLNYSVEEAADLTTWDVPLETGVRAGGLLFHSTFNYSKADTAESFERLMTKVVKDSRRSLVRYTLGDFSASSGQLGGGAVMGGVNVQKNYSIDPFYPRYNSLDYSGAVSSPSEIEVWKDGTLLDRIDVGPGRFELTDLPVTTGSGKVELVIKDAFGREERVEIPYYHSTSLLKKGTHEFSYSAGMLRENIGEEDNGYGDTVFLVFHRYGLTRLLTIGVRYEADEHISSAGLSFVFTLGKTGLIEAAGSSSRSDSGNGNAWLYGYSYLPARGGVNFNVQQSGYSLEYGNLSLAPAEDRPKRSLQASVSKSLGNLGTLALSYTRDDYYLGEDTNRVAANYSTKLLRNLSMNAGWSRGEIPEEVEEAHLSLNYSFDSGITANLFRSESDKDDETSFSLQKGVSDRRGLGYRLSALELEAETGDVTRSTAAEANYYHSLGILTGRYNETDGSGSWDLVARGSIAFLDGSFHFGQPVNDSFAVVDVGDAEGVTVSHDNVPVAETNGVGKAYVPFLGSYYVNKLSVEELDLPFNYSLARDEINVSVPYRGGALVEFEVERIQHIVGKMNIVRNGETSPAKYWGLRIDVDGEEVVTPIGSSGQFYLENVPPGTHQVTVYKGEKECRFELGIPERDSVEIDIGTITCNLDQ